MKTSWDAAPVFLVRLMVGSVFLSEGIQKFLFQEALGVGRFVKIGIPAPQIMAPFVGVVEIFFGALILIGLFTRLAAIPLTINILVAIASTKIPMLFDGGFWKMAHESRVDWSMLLGLICLLLVGGGRWSLDERARTRAENSTGSMNAS
jgi:uncharacterized membrane protein YphA (DoxX/SURF4 family)